MKELFLDGIKDIDAEEYIYWIHNKFRELFLDDFEEDGIPLGQFPSDDWSEQEEFDKHVMKQNPLLKDFMSRNIDYVVYAYPHASRPYFSSYFSPGAKILLCVYSDASIKKPGNYIAQMPVGGCQYPRIFDECASIPPNIKRIYSRGLTFTEDRFVPVAGGICSQYAQIFIEHVKFLLQTPKKFENFLLLPLWADYTHVDRPTLRPKFQGNSWVTLGEGFASTALDEIYNHKFCLTPIGNAANPYRLWECLYAGTIPVLLKSEELSWFDDLPILQLDSWDEINEDFLNSKFDEIHSKKYSMYKLKFSYWLDMIQKDVDEIRLQLSKNVVS